MQDITQLLQPLVGRWATTITMLHPPAEAGRKYMSTDIYRWMPGQKVLIHDVEANMGEPVVSMEVYTQGEDGAIVSRNFDSHGQVSDYRASMKDGIWRVEGDKETLESRLVSAGKVEGLWRLKTDGGWVDWMTVALERVQQSRTPEDNKRVLEAANAAIIRGDFDGFLGHCTEDTEWEFLGDRTLKGKAEVRRYMEETYQQPPRFHVDELIADGDWLAALGEITLVEEGKRVTHRYCDVWQLREGKLAKLQAFVV